MRYRRFHLLFVVLLVLGLWEVGPLLGEELNEVVARLNQQLQATWKQAEVAAPAQVDDAGFLRRVSLDLIGTLPTPAEAAAFIDDRSSTKREQLVDKLLADSRYATRWADYWDAVLMGRLSESAVVDRRAFHTWLTEQFQQNTSWDKLVHALLTAEGINTSGQAFIDPASKPVPGQNAAVNWTIKHTQSLPDLAAATTRIFLGVQLQCAQCHDHKTEKWTQKDFQQFTAFFAKTWPILHGSYAMSGRVGLIQLDLRDRIIAPPTGGKLEPFFGSYKEYVGLTPKTLDGQTASVWKNRRQALAQWVTKPENPWFASALVNRLWAELLGTGFVEPIDDFRPGNPAVAPEILEMLADDFRSHGFNLQRTLQIMMRSQAYQAACRVNEPYVPRNGYWSRYPLKPLSIEALFDSVLTATGANEPLTKLSLGRLDLIRGAFVQQFVIQMGTDEMTETSAQEESISRALLQMNGVLFAGAVQTGNQLALDQLLKTTANDEARIEQLYLRTLSRRPDAAELSHWLKFVQSKRQVALSKGPVSTSPYVVKGLGAIMTSPEIRKAPPEAELRDLLKYARTAADFGVLAKRMDNLVDAGLYVKALREFAAEAPFQSLMEHGGGTTPQAQAYEDLFWALLNSSEFLNNH